MLITTGHATIFPTDNSPVTGPAVAFKLIKMCGEYVAAIQHEYLYLFTEQQPHNHEAMRSGDAKHDNRGGPNFVTNGPTGSIDSALDEFLSIKAQNTVFVNSPSALCKNLVVSWSDTGSQRVKQVDNKTPAEYVIRSELKIVLLESYLPISSATRWSHTRSTATRCGWIWQ